MRHISEISKRGSSSSFPLELPAYEEPIRFCLCCVLRLYFVSMTETADCRSALVACVLVGIASELLRVDQQKACPWFAHAACVRLPAVGIEKSNCMYYCTSKLLNAELKLPRKIELRNALLSVMEKSEHTESGIGSTAWSPWLWTEGSSSRRP